DPEAAREDDRIGLFKSRVAGADEHRLVLRPRVVPRLRMTAGAGDRDDLVVDVGKDASRPGRGEEARRLEGRDQRVGGDAVAHGAGGALREELAANASDEAALR